MPVSNVDPNAKESKTVTAPYGGGVKPQAVNVNSPSIHDLAVQQVEEAHGPHARNLPDFKERVAETERQMLDSVEKTKDL